MKRTNSIHAKKGLQDIAIKALAAMETKTTPETTRPLSKHIATRDRTIDYFTVALSGLPNPDPVLKKLGRAIEVYEDLMFDSRVSACVQSRKSAVQCMEWDVIGEDAKEEHIKFHKSYLLRYKMEDIISELLDAPLFGYKPNEIIWNEREGKIVPVNLVGKPPRWFKYDDENKLRFITLQNMILGEEVPDNKFIVARHEPTYDNPYGKPALSSCFWPVTFRKNGFKFWTIFMEKYGMPFLVGKAPAGEQTDRIEAVADMLENMIQDAIAVVPSEYEVDIVESAHGRGGKGETPHKSYLDAMNLEIAMSILGTNLTTEVQGGSYAASQSHMEVRDDIVESDARIVEGVMDELIELTQKINFGDSSPCPYFKLFAEEKIDESRSKRDVNLKKIGVRFKKDYFKRAYNLTDEDIEDPEDVQAVAVPAGAGEEVDE